jgi:hypothetical protein
MQYAQCAAQATNDEAAALTADTPTAAEMAVLVCDVPPLVLADTIGRLGASNYSGGTAVTAKRDDDAGASDVGGSEEALALPPVPLSAAMVKMPGGQRFKKAWRVRNASTTSWPQVRHHSHQVI